MQYSAFLTHRVSFYMHYNADMEGKYLEICNLMHTT